MSTGTIANPALAQELLDALDALSGLHPGFRPAHAKGLMCSGTFTPAAEAAKLTRAPHVAAPSTPVTVRYSDGTGLPNIPDNDPARSGPRGIAIRFHVGDHAHTDIIAHSTNGFPVRTGKEFVEFVHAVAKFGAGQPEALGAFLAAHPNAKRFVETPKPIPTSFAREAFFAVTSFKFTNAEGISRHGRFRIRPEAGTEYLSNDDAAAKSANFLFDEIGERLARGPIRLGVFVQMAEPGDEVADASITWPDARKEIPFGTISLTAPADDQVPERRRIIFDPLPRIDGIDSSGDPLTDVRADVYLLSGRRRRAALATDADGRHDIKGKGIAMRDPAKFGAETTASEVAEGIDLSNKVALVTGGSSGLGQETARVLAERRAHVILTARDVPKGEAVAAAIRASTGNEHVEVEELELGSLKDIRAFAQRFLERHAMLHILINNAGVMACPPAKTADGFELQFGSNHLGHFLMTCLLASALLRAAPGRVVSVSSRGHHMSPVVFDDIQFERRPYDKWLAYGQSKTANVLFAVGLERRLGARGVHANALHPGGIMTELSRHLQQDDWQFLQARTRGMKFKTVEAGAATSVFAATAPELEGRGGLYLEDCRVAAVNDAPDALDGVKSYALDPDNAERLWEVSEMLVGERFPMRP